MTGGYLRVAGVLSGIGGRVMLHGGSQDIDIASSSQWPVISVTSWAGSPEIVDESGKGVMSEVVSPPEVVDSSGMKVMEELASVPDVDSGVFERPEIVLTTVVTTSVLSGLPNVSEPFIVVIVLTNVVITSALDWISDVPETVVAMVTLSGVPDSKPVEAVTSALLLLPTGAVRAAVWLLWLEAVSMPLVVDLLWLKVPPMPVEMEGEVETCGWLEFVKEAVFGETCSLPFLVIDAIDVSLSELVAIIRDEFTLKLAGPVVLVSDRVVWEVNTVIDEIELDVLWAVFEMVTCVLDAGTGETVGRGTMESFLLVTSVPVILEARVVLFGLVAANVWLEPPVPGTDSSVTTVGECATEELEAAESMEEFVVWVPMPEGSILGEVAAVVAVWLLPDVCPTGDREATAVPLMASILAVSLMRVVPFGTLLGTSWVERIVDARWDLLKVVPVQESIELGPIDVSTTVCSKLPVGVARTPVPLRCPVAIVTFPTPVKPVEFPCPMTKEPAILTFEAPASAEASEDKKEDNGGQK
jgi:hypothetical protein